MNEVNEDEMDKNLIHLARAMQFGVAEPMMDERDWSISHSVAICSFPVCVCVCVSYTNLDKIILFAQRALYALGVRLCACGRDRESEITVNPVSQS